MYQYVLFDLDGTLDNSCPGITKSVAHALTYFGIEADPQSLLGFIGPPLTWSFPHYYPVTEGKTAFCMEKFREYYNEKGYLEGQMYRGIPHLLQALKEAGIRLGVATSKPEMYVLPILTHMGIEEYFDVACGADPDETLTKADVIRDAIEQLGAPPKETVLMVGDREHDIIGATLNGLDACGVLWGYGSEEELQKHGAKYIVKTPEDLANLLVTEKKNGSF